MTDASRMLVDGRAKSPSSRDDAIDIVRGLCIASMVLTHLASGSTVMRLVHFQPWVDGASGFVLMSGLVLGMVNRRTMDTAGLKAVARKSSRRVVLLYTAHVGIVSLATVVGFSTLREGLPGSTSVSIPEQIMWTLTLQVNPDYVDMLSMYVIFISATSIVIALLVTGRTWIAVALSGVVYAAGLVTPFGHLPNRPFGSTFFDIAEWQLLFFSAFVLGWNWLKVRDRLRSKRALALAVTVGALTVIVVHFLPVPALRTALFDKSTSGPGRILLAWCAFVALYQLARVASARIPKVVEPIRTAGTRSLACFIVLCVAVLLVPLAIGPETDTAAAETVAIVMIAAMYPVAIARGWAGRSLSSLRRPSRTRSDAVRPRETAPAGGTATSQTTLRRHGEDAR